MTTVVTHAQLMKRELYNAMNNLSKMELRLSKLADHPYNTNAENEYLEEIVAGLDSIYEQMNALFEGK